MANPMRQKDAKPGRTTRTTEPMNAVEIAELASLDLDFVMGGCSACGCSQPDSVQNPYPAQPAGRR